MNDHEHDYFRTLSDALECRCGHSLRQSRTSTERERSMSTTETPALSPAELAKVEAFGIHDEEPTDG